MNDEFRFSPDALATLRSVDLCDPLTILRFKDAIQTEIERSNNDILDDSIDIEDPDFCQAVTECLILPAGRKNMTQ
jgi:hypothetical protein